MVVEFWLIFKFFLYIGQILQNDYKKNLFKKVSYSLIMRVIDFMALKNCYVANHCTECFVLTDSIIR
jgi:hypothetical protein